MCNVQPTPCLPDSFPSIPLTYSTFPLTPAHLNPTDQTNQWSPDHPCPPTLTSFFLSWVHWAEKEFRGFTGPEETCVPYSCVVHWRSGIGALLCPPGWERQNITITKLLLYRHGRIGTDLREKIIRQRLQSFLLLCKSWLQIRPLCDLWNGRVFVLGQSAIGNTHTHSPERDRATHGEMLWSRTPSIVGHTISFQPVKKKNIGSELLS